MICFLACANFCFGQEVKLGLPIGHSRDVVSAEFSPDQRYIVTASKDHSALLWDVRSGRVIHSFKGHTDVLSMAKFSPDGKFVATASYDSSIKLWDVSTGKLKRTFSGHDAAVLSVNFSSNGKLIISASSDNSANIWNAETGEKMHRLKKHKAIVSSASFSLDGKNAITSCRDGKVRTWGVKNGDLISTILGHDGWADFACFSPGRDLIFSSSWNQVFYTKNKPAKEDLVLNSSKESSPFSNNGKWAIIPYGSKLQIWNIKLSELIVELEGPGNFSSAKFSLDDNFIIGNDGERINLWNTTTGKIDHFINCPLEDIRTMTLSNDNKMILISEFGRDPVLWDVRTGNIVHELKSYTSDLFRTVSSSDETFIASSTFDGKKVVLSDYKTGQTIRSFFSKEIIRFIKIGPDSKYLFIGTENGSIDQINLKSGLIYNSFKGHTGWINSIEFSNDGKKMLTASVDKTAILWELSTGNILQKYSGHNEVVYLAKFNHSNNNIVSTSRDKTVKIWDTETGELLHDMLGHSSWVRYAEFSPNDQFVVSTSKDKTAILWSTRTGNLLKRFNQHQGWVTKVDFNPKGDHFVTTSRDGTSKIWNTQSMQLVQDLTGHTDRVLSSKYSSSGKTILTASEDGTAKIWNAKTGEIIRDFDKHTDKVLTAEFSLDGKTILTSSKDGSIASWNVETGEFIIRRFVFENDEHKTIILTKDGYYQSKNASKMLYYVRSNQVFSADQFDLKYNRPDIVLERTGSASRSTIESYRRAYEKRLEKMGFTEDMLKDEFHIPTSEIINQEAIPPITADTTLNLTLHLSDSIYLLDRINIWVNNIPIYGVNGITLRTLNTREIDTSVMILLSNGSNKIEVSVLNQAGAESYKESLQIKANYMAPKPNLYFMGIGVQEYTDANMNLSFSAKDIRDIAELYSSNANKTFGKVIIDTFINENVTKSITSIITEKLKNTTIHDQVVFMYSGHGVIDDSLNYYLTTHNIDFNNPQKEGIPYEDVDRFMDGIPARQKLILIDACNSGELDKDEIEIVQSETELTAVLHSKSFGNIVKSRGNSFELMQELFTDIRRGTGSTIIASSSGKYYSYEDEKFQNGVYTYALKEALSGRADQNENGLNVSELKSFLYERVQSLTNGRQKPTARQENLEFDFRVW